ncbi:MAG: hypothetical protein AAFU77_03200 [Myxococcota bacterium]
MKFDGLMVGFLAVATVLPLGCGDNDDTSDSPLSGAHFGLIRSDSESTSIAVLDAEGEIVSPSVLSSGSQPPGLVAPLSGDVVLSNSRRGAEGVLNIVDRFGTDVYTRYDLEGSQVIGQLRVAPGDFSTNPQDVALVDENRGWVSRFSVNLDPAADAENQANDVIEIDPSNFTETGRRVSLESFTDIGTAQTDEGPMEVDVFARPSLLALVGDTLVVGLTLLSAAFDAALPGQVALIDVGTAQVSGFALPAASRNCGNLRAVPDREDLVMVACSGFAQPFGDEPQVRASSGVYVLRITRGQAELVESWEPADDMSRPLALQNVVPLGATQFLAVEFGTFGVSGDEAFVVDMETGEATSLFAATAAFSIGLSAYDSATGVLLVPDSASGALRRYREDTNGFSLETSLTFSDGPLPPRSMYLLP